MQRSKRAYWHSINDSVPTNIRILAVPLLAISGIMFGIMTTTKITAKPPDEKPFKLSREERFWRLYLAAFGNLHAGFGKNTYPDGEEAEYRCKDYAKIAWRSATEACQLFDQEKNISEFNKKVNHVH
jgi:hypothetical protein